MRGQALFGGETQALKSKVGERAAPRPPAQPAQPLNRRRGNYEHRSTQNDRNEEVSTGSRRRKPHAGMEPDEKKDAA